MTTVVLDAKRKVEVLADINEYLHPATPRWYANRGIPYRRGYLFHGPPGSGKTSLSFALAGVFGLDIYVISLLDSTLTEDELGNLFSTLPRRCVVLLEDIDTAGLVRAESLEPEVSSPVGSDSKKSDDWKMKEIVKNLRHANAAAEEEKKKGISLSGLLNAIDGVASHEGRVLIMTTNYPEKLDSALIRPGRVDFQVAFSNATTEQIRELFERMYTPEKDQTFAIETGKEATSTQSPVSENGKAATTSLVPPILSPSTPTHTSSATVDATAPTSLVPAGFGQPARSLEACAREFARQIPDGRFSPAEIQGFLLKRKKEPQRACAEVGRWVEGMTEGMKGGRKVLSVQ